MWTRGTPHSPFMCCFLLISPPHFYNASLLSASLISCLVGYDVTGRGGLVLREGNELPGHSCTKTPVSEPALCPSAPPTYSLAQHKKAPKTHFRPPRHRQWSTTTAWRGDYRMAVWRKHVTSNLHLHTYESFPGSLNKSIMFYIYPPTVSEPKGVTKNLHLGNADLHHWPADKPSRSITASSFLGQNEQIGTFSSGFINWWSVVWTQTQQSTQRLS